MSNNFNIVCRLLGATLSYHVAPKKTLNLIDTTSSQEKSKIGFKAQNDTKLSYTAKGETSLNGQPFTSKTR